MKLNVTNHDRDSADYTYVYPVVSRRARGVSVGLNLNPNNACNFRCIYCQVPGLQWGKGPEIDLDQFERELRGMLEQVLHGDFMAERVPEGNRRLNDLAFSGNGEPTSSPQFAECVEIAGKLMAEFGLLGEAGVKLVLITNGTLTDRPNVEAALSRMKDLNGEIWFKLDSGTQEGAQRINQNNAPMAARLKRLTRVAELCPTWVQTCLFKLDDREPSAEEQREYLSALETVLKAGAPPRGVLLYGLARPSMQPEAPRLSKLSEAWLADFAERIRQLGLEVRVSA